MRQVILFAFILVILCDSPRVLRAEGFGPFPVRNFQALDQLVLGMPGERAAVLRKGDFDVRLEVANTATIARDSEEQAEVSMKFETIRAGLFLRYGLTDRFEIGAEIPTLHRYDGFMDGAIKGVESLTTGVSPPRKALEGTNYAFNISNGGRTLFRGSNGATGLGDVSFYGKYQVLRKLRAYRRCRSALRSRPRQATPGRYSEAATRMPASVWRWTRLSPQAGSCMPT